MTGQVKLVSVSATIGPRCRATRAYRYLEVRSPIPKTLAASQTKRWTLAYRFKPAVLDCNKKGGAEAPPPSILGGDEPRPLTPRLEAQPC